MAVTNPFKITYGTREVGGDPAVTNYQLHGPHVIDKSHDNIRLVFDVIVVGTSYADLKTLSEDLENDFRKRLVKDQTLLIDIGGSVFTFTHGSTILNTRASISKTGNEETDKGFSRAYTVVIEGELPADADNGLRDVEVLVDFESGGQMTVTMRGTYTALSPNDAIDQYKADFDAEANVYLTSISTTANRTPAVTWELVDESFTLDRELNALKTAPDSHLCNFTRQYVELLEKQSRGSLDDSEIRDHRVVFTDLSQHPGDGKESIHRLRRVIGSYDCAIDIAQTTDLLKVYEDKVRDHVIDLFKANFVPTVFAVEDERVGYDQTSRRLSVSIQLIYQVVAGTNIIEISQSVAFRETRNLDYTFTHDPDELAAEVDLGFATLERIWNRTAITLGDEAPKLRITGKPLKGDVGLFDDEIGGQDGPDKGGGRRGVSRAGWNIVQNTSQVTPQWVGNPDNEQFEVMVLTETVVERFTRRPGTRTEVPIQRQAITPRK